MFSLVITLLITVSSLIVFCTSSLSLPVPFINAFIVDLRCENMFKLSKLNAVKYITQSAKVSALVNVANKILHTESKVGVNGANFSIAVIDTGIYPHLDFMVPHNKIVKFVDLVNNKDLPYDDNGHGTFISGVIAGNGTVDSKYIGIDPFSNIISIKALDKNGETSASNILTAMQWVYDNKDEYNIKIPNDEVQGWKKFQDIVNSIYERIK